MASKKTLVIGASTNPERYSYKAINKLRDHNHEVIAYSKKAGEVRDVAFETEWNPDWKVDTVTIYVRPAHQSEFIDKVIALKPNRVIFNPETENQEFFDALNHVNIPYEAACTLVLLSINQY